MGNLPKRINVIKTVTYEVETLRNDLGIEFDTVDDILEYIEEWVSEEFGGVSGLVFQDENGEELTT